MIQFKVNHIQVFRLIALFFFFLFSARMVPAQEPAKKKMDEMWEGKGNVNAETNLSRGKLFRDGKYAMFIHWGLYSQIGNQWKGKTYYGIAEWIMNSNMANITLQEYMAVAKDFNPVNFNAKAIAQLAKDAGMKYIVVTSKHHDGFAMFHSKDNKFNIVDATPFKRDPMIELAQACKNAGLGFGFYYSQNQDWTAPGGNGGPQKDEQGNKKSFDDFFKEKCYPQVKQITTEYGPIELVWFDTPGGMDKKYAEQLVELVHKNQPGAYVSGRVGHNLGDYTTLGDMEVPKQNVEGLWESVDVTNDSWGYAGYDQNWKSPKEILTRALSTVARGGTYMLNVGPKPDGTIPEQAAMALLNSGTWIKKYPQTIYGAKASPWKHALPWGDATVQGNKISLLVYDWPVSGHLYLSGLRSEITSVKLLNNGKHEPLLFSKKNGWIDILVPAKAPEMLVSVVEITVKGDPKANSIQSIDPQIETTIHADFATAINCEKNGKSWMEKFGEWKHINEVIKWTTNSKLEWEVEVLKPGYYQTELNYTGVGRLVWKIESSGGAIVQNQQNSSSVYSWYPMGWMKFEHPGKYTLSVSLLGGDKEKASLSAIKFKKID
ncbi:alpha-L-fucosidase [Pedobacter borealis]|uniref:alpha-L-fucosidase n=1 Tax=Pedobacter borealis TaxID=475254 RepID=UPI00049341F0|nr:alpha-L-fucosidase [Pedobacter borealis]